MDKHELDTLKQLAESIKEKLEGNLQDSLFKPEELSNLSVKSVKSNTSDYEVNLKNIEEEARIVRGIHEVYGALFDDLGFQSIFKKPTKSVIKMFRDIVLARVANPQSKRSSVALLEEDFGISLNLDLVYRMMDRLDEATIEQLNKFAYNSTKSLFKEKIDVIFFDCTTLYFESFTEDEFKKNGYSKDLKFNQPQVLIALMVTKEGLPVGYQAFPGDTYEGHTIIPIIKNARLKYDLDKVIFVADAGMLSDVNLKEIEALKEHHIEYIVGARLKNLPNDLKKDIVDTSKYEQVEGELRIGTFTYGNRTLIVSHSDKRARKNAHDRDKALERLQKKLKNSKNLKQYLSNHGYKKYLQLKGKNSIELNQEKIKADKQWDGLHGVITNAKNLSKQEILNQYHNLWQVENAFRITKHDLKVRPIFHWKPKRVQAHLAICFAAYTLVKHMEYRVRVQYAKLSPEKIRQTLIRVQTSILWDKEKHIRYGLPSRMSQDAKKIYRLCGINSHTTAYIIEKS